MDYGLNVEHYTFLIGAAEHKRRLDAVLVAHLPKDYSRTQLQQAIAQGQVQVNGVTATKRHALVHRGDRIEAQVKPLSRDITLLPEQIPLDIVYEDEYLLVVNKPPGLVTHPAVGHWSGTLVNAVLGHLQGQGAGDRGRGVCPVPLTGGKVPDALRPGIVHRLDKDTSGLLLVAKDASTQHQLARQLQQRTIKRTYLAVVRGLVKRDEGTINAPIGRHPKHRKEFAVRPEGKPAVTHYRVLHRHDRSDYGPYTVLTVRLETGRTHQIRVHMAHLGHPVLGDSVYGARAPGQPARQLLHAHRLEFVHPILKQSLQMEAPLPNDFPKGQYW